MGTHFSITIRFLQTYSHGRAETGQPEWPPSPLRLFQAMVAASAGRWNERALLTTAMPALRWLQHQEPPWIVADAANVLDQPFRLFVPDNVGDRVAGSWCKGREADIAEYRAEKDVWPLLLFSDAVHYIYPLAEGKCPHLDVLTAAARSITHLGWGIDMATGDATVLSAEEATDLEGHRWQPGSVGGTPLRVPVAGTLDDLMRKHEAFLNRLSSDGFRPVPPLKTFRVCRYRRDDEPCQRPYRLFELRQADGDRFRYPQRQFIHLAGMTRHLAIETMKSSPPADAGADWVEAYVAGHAAADTERHRQLSYVPLPSLGHPHTDPGVRRIMIVAPLGDDAWLDHVARRLAGQMLSPSRDNEFAGSQRPLLVPFRYDKVTHRYLSPATTWASVTPVILPGHDDHKPAKTRRLIERALQQSGINQPCEFEWGAFSHFPKSLSAHKCDRNGKVTGYIRPDHLMTQTAVHLKLRFCDGLTVPGPLVIGAGRHCGFGLMAGIDE